MTNECEECGMDCGVELLCEQCKELREDWYAEPSELEEWHDYDPDC